MQNSTTTTPVLSFPTLPNGATVIAMVRSTIRKNQAVVLAVVPHGGGRDGTEPQRVCWMVDIDLGNAYWGAYGEKQANAAFLERIARESGLHHPGA